MLKWEPPVVCRGTHQPAAVSGRILRGFGATAGSIITAGEIGRFQQGLNESAAPDAGAALMEEIEGSGADMTGAPRRGGQHAGHVTSCIALVRRCYGRASAAALSSARGAPS